MIPGVQFLVDDDGKKRSVLIDLDLHGDLWEDIYDSYVARSRKDEPHEDWEEVKRELGLETS